MPLPVCVSVSTLPSVSGSAVAALAAYLLRAAWCTATDRSSAGRREAPLRAFTLASVLVRRGVAADQVSWAGFALGTAAAACIALQLPLAGLALRMLR